MISVVGGGVGLFVSRLIVGEESLDFVVDIENGVMAWQGGIVVVESIFTECGILWVDFICDAGIVVVVGIAQHVRMLLTNLFLKV